MRRSEFSEARWKALRTLVSAGATAEYAAVELGLSKSQARDKMAIVRREMRKAAAEARGPQVKAPGSYGGLASRLNRSRPVAPGDLSRLRLERFKPLDGREPVPFEELTPGRCKWPIGDILARKTVCCGADAPDGPYCAEHEAFNRDPPETRRVDRQVINPAVRRMERAA